MSLSKSIHLYLADLVQKVRATLFLGPWVIVDLLMDSSLYNFGNYRNNGNWPEFEWVREIAGFVDRMND